MLPSADESADYYRWLFFAAGPVEQAVVSRSMGWEVPKDREMMVGWGSYDRTIAALEGHFEGNDFVCGAALHDGRCLCRQPGRLGTDLRLDPARTRPSSPMPNGCRRARAYKAAKAIDHALIEESKQ